MYSTLLFLSFCMHFGIAETGIARGSPPGTTTEVLRVGFPSAEIRVVTHVVFTLCTMGPSTLSTQAPYLGSEIHGPSTQVDSGRTFKSTTVATIPWV
jgi:hypothetical protein